MHSFTLPHLFMCGMILCLSVTSRSSVNTAERIELFFCHPFYYTVLKKFGYLQKFEYFPLELCPKLRTQKILSQHIDRWKMLPTYLEKAGRSEHDKLGHRRSSKLTIPLSSNAYTLVYHRWSSSSVYSTVPSHGSVTHYTVSQKKQDTKLLAITSLIIIRFSKFFH